MIMLTHLAQFFPLPGLAEKTPKATNSSSNPSEGTEMDSAIADIIKDHVSSTFNAILALQEMEAIYPWVQHLFCGMLTKRIFVGAKPTETKVEDFDEKIALYIGRSMSKSLQDSSDPLKGVFRWMKRNPSMRALDEKYIFFAPMCLAIAKHLGLAKNIKSKGRAGHRSTAKNKSADMKELQKELRRASFGMPGLKGNSSGNSSGKSVGMNGQQSFHDLTDSDCMSYRDSGSNSSAGLGQVSGNWEEQEAEDDEIDEAMMDRLGDAEDRVVDIDCLLETGEDVDETDGEYTTSYIVVKRQKTFAQKYFPCLVKKRRKKFS